MVDQARERETALALWSVWGVGALGLTQLRNCLGGKLAPLWDVPAKEWADEAPFNASTRARLRAADPLPLLAERTREEARAGGMEIAFLGDPDYPPNLAETNAAPPLLFVRGHIGRPQRWAAMVGSRHPDNGFLALAEDLAARVALEGVGIVSGAAEGVDQVCQKAAAAVGQATWAFLGSALDCPGASQAQLIAELAETGAVFFSELPPGVEASKATYPRRNRLISGAADAVVILRAGLKSGALHTAKYARLQGRPVLAMPAEARNEFALGSNGLLRDGDATACLCATDVLRALGLPSEAREAPKKADRGRSGPALDLTERAEIAYQAVRKQPMAFEEVLARSGLPADVLASALCELELFGLVVQHPGKLYERI